MSGVLTNAAVFALVLMMMPCEAGLKWDGSCEGDDGCQRPSEVELTSSPLVSRSSGLNAHCSHHSRHCRSISTHEGRSSQSCHLRSLYDLLGS